MSHSKKFENWTINDFMSFVSSLGIKGTNYDQIRKAMEENSLSPNDIKGTVEDIKELFCIPKIIAGKVNKALMKLRVDQKVKTATSTSNPYGTTSASGGSTGSFPVTLRSKQGKRVTLRRQFTTNSSIANVAKAFKDEECVQLHYKIEKISLESGGKTLLYEKTLGYYKIVDQNNLITVVFKARGGAQAVENEDRCIKFKKYGLIKTSIPDILIGYDDDDGIDRALLDCGKHGMAADTMFMYICSSLSSHLRQRHIFCPGKGCGKVLNWQRCTQIADMNRHEYLKWTDIIEKRAMADCKQCPHCKVYCKRDEGVAIFRMRCIACSNIDWCWQCAQPWRGSGLSMCCNQNCCIIKDTNYKLAHCHMVKVAYTNVEMPTFRACPRCLTFMEYTAACKHMVCGGCDKDFCFVCLGLKDHSTNKWPCGSHTTVCTMAPRQTFK